MGRHGHEEIGDKERRLVPSVIVRFTVLWAVGSIRSRVLLWGKFLGFWMGGGNLGVDKVIWLGPIRMCDFDTYSVASGDFFFL